VTPKGPTYTDSTEKIEIPIGHILLSSRILDQQRDIRRHCSHSIPGDVEAVVQIGSIGTSRLPFDFGNDASLVYVNRLGDRIAVGQYVFGRELSLRLAEMIQVAAELPPGVPDRYSPTGRLIPLVRARSPVYRSYPIDARVEPPWDMVGDKLAAAEQVVFLDENRAEIDGELFELKSFYGREYMRPIEDVVGARPPTVQVDPGYILPTRAAPTTDSLGDEAYDQHIARWVAKLAEAKPADTWRTREPLFR
jgi:hypothetical protein